MNKRGFKKDDLQEDGKKRREELMKKIREEQRDKLRDEKQLPEELTEELNTTTIIDFKTYDIETWLLLLTLKKCYHVKFMYIIQYYNFLYSLTYKYLLAYNTSKEKEVMMEEDVGESYGGTVPSTQIGQASIQIIDNVRCLKIFFDGIISGRLNEVFLQNADKLLFVDLRVSDPENPENYFYCTVLSSSSFLSNNHGQLEWKDIFHSPMNVTWISNNKVVNIFLEYQKQGLNYNALGYHKPRSLKWVRWIVPIILCIRNFFSGRTASSAPTIRSLVRKSGGGGTAGIIDSLITYIRSLISFFSSSFSPDKQMVDDVEYTQIHDSHVIKEVMFTLLFDTLPLESMEKAIILQFYEDNLLVVKSKSPDDPEIHIHIYGDDGIMVRTGYDLKNIINEKFHESNYECSKDSGVYYPIDIEGKKVNIQLRCLSERPCPPRKSWWSSVWEYSKYVPLLSTFALALVSSCKLSAGRRGRRQRRKTKKQKTT